MICDMAGEFSKNPLIHRRKQSWESEPLFLLLLCHNPANYLGIEVAEQNF